MHPLGMLVFERHTPKEKITTEKVAVSAGQPHAQARWPAAHATRLSVELA